MIDNLPLFHRVSDQPIIVVGSGEAAQAKRRLVARAGGHVIASIEDGIARGARIAFVAHDDDERALADAARLRNAGILVNAADRPDLCDFTVPSILDRSPVLLAIGTGGASAGLAKALRLRLEAILPQSLGRLAAALGAARQRLRARWPDAGDRRRAIDAALGEGGALDPLAEDRDARVDGWLTGSDGDVRSGGVIEIVLDSCDPEDLTLKQARHLGGADIIAHRPGVPAVILDRARADAARVELAADQAAPESDGLVVVISMKNGVVAER